MCRATCPIASRLVSSSIISGLRKSRITNDVCLQDARLQQLLVDYQNGVLKAQQEEDNGISTFLQSRVQLTSCAAGPLRPGAR